MRLDFAYATRTVLYVMAAIMVAAAVVAFVGLRPGVQEEVGRGPEPDPVGRRATRSGTGVIRLAPWHSHKEG